MGLRVAVVGAGIVGSAVTAKMAERGADVILLEAGRPVSGTSGATFAWLNSNGKTPERYHHLNVAGMEMHRQFALQAGSTDWYHTGGNLEWADDPAGAEALTKKIERLNDLDYPVKWITRAEAMRMEPDLIADALPEDGIAFFPDEAWVDPPVLAAILLEMARSHGARVVTSSPVTGFELSGDQITQVVTGQDRFSVDAVVNCAGPEADLISDMAGLSLPISKEPGLIVTTEPAPVRFGRVMHAPGVNARPAGAGRIMVHSSVSDELITNSLAVPRSAVDYLLEELARLMRQIRSIQVEGIRVGVRPIPPDRLPALGATEEVPNFYQCVSHSGVTLCLKLADVMAAHVVTGQWPSELDTYRLDATGRRLSEQPADARTTR